LFDKIQHVFHQPRGRKYLAVVGDPLLRSNQVCQGSLFSAKATAPPAALLICPLRIAQ